MVALHSDRVYHSGDWQMTGLQMLSGTGEGGGGGKNGWNRKKTKNAWGKVAE